MVRVRIGVMETHADSLSMLSPKPGVSTMVRAMRTPSSSSSVAVVECHAGISKRHVKERRLRTNVDGLDLDTLLNVCGLRVV